MIIVDAHVHIYHCFKLSHFFLSAFDNFSSISKKYGYETFLPIIALADWSNYRWYERLRDMAVHGPPPDLADQFVISETRDPLALSIRNNQNRQLFVIAGRKIISAENLEVLALGSLNDFPDGKSLHSTVSIIAQSGAIPIIPWAVGKWLGKRGKILKEMIEGNQRPSYFLCDNSNRPMFWPWPKHFKIAQSRGIPTLAGSDPLHFPSETKRVGSFGFFLNKSLDTLSPAKDLCRILSEPPSNIQLYGPLEGLYPFLVNQVRMQIFKKKWHKELIK